MFAVVQNNSKGYYIVCSKWLARIENDPNNYTYYPPSGMHNQFVKKQADIEDDWEYEEVEIMLRNVTGTPLI